MNVIPKENEQGKRRREIFGCENACVLKMIYVLNFSSFMTSFRYGENENAVKNKRAPQILGA
jgi:hypothetical protein